MERELYALIIFATLGRTMSIEIRQARAGDGAALHAMVRSLAESHGELADIPRLARRLRDGAVSVKTLIVGALLALADGVPAGCAIWHRSFSTFRGSETMYLEDLSVLEAFRRRGIARMLLKAVARLAIRRVAWPSISWHLMAWNDGARTLYEAAGAEIEEGVCICRLHGEALERLAVMISYVVAVSKNGVIGRDGGLPWHISTDLKRFKEITMGKPVVMGRKTWDSLPRKPLPGRRNIVITRQAGYRGGGSGGRRDARGSAGALRRRARDRGDRRRRSLPAVLAHGRSPLPHRSRPGGRGRHAFSGSRPGRVDGSVREFHPQGPKDTASFILRVLDRKPT